MDNGQFYNAVGSNRFFYLGGNMTIGTISIIIGVVLLIFLKIFFKDTGNEETGHLTIDEDPWSDSGWSILTGNLFNRKNK